MSDIYSVVAAFGTTIDAQGAYQKLERSGLHTSALSIENRVSPLQQRTPDQYSADSDIGSWAITGALMGGAWGILVNEDRFQTEHDGVLHIEPLLSCLGFAAKGACIFAGVSLVNRSMNGGILSPQFMRDEPTLAVDPYLLVVHGTRAAVTFAGDVLRAA